MEYVKSVRTQGYTDGTDSRGNQVTRDQMAVYVPALSSPTGTPTRPLPPGDAELPGRSPPSAYKYVEYCHANSIVNGYPDGTYQPGGIVTRDQMAVYVQRAFQLPM